MSIATSDLRAAPVVGGEGEECHHADAERGRGLDDPADHARTLTVARRAGAAAAAVPTDRCRP